MEKNKTSGLIPYKQVDGTLYFFLQHRTEDAPHNPGMYGIFGGKRKGNETPEETLFRECQEELEYTPINHQLLGEFEEQVSVVSLFYEKVPEGFETRITIHEGQGGVFVSEDEIAGHQKIQVWHQTLLHTLRDHITQNTT